MSTSASNCLNQTITLDSSNATDIIDCSIDEIYNKNDYFETPRHHLQRKCKRETKNEVISLKGFQFKNENQQVKIPAVDKINSSLRCKPWPSLNLDDSAISGSSIIPSSTPERPKTKTEDQTIPKLTKLLPSLANSPYLPYLCKSKLNRIENWLNENDVETVSTPPFSNCSGTSSVRLRKTSSTQSLKKITARRRASSDSSSVDSEVKEVLVAVYGKDWKNKNVFRKCKTEPKKNKKEILNTKTDIKTKTKSEVKSFRTARRNILKDDILRGRTNKEEKPGSSVRDSPTSLGVGKLNESDSYDDVSGKHPSSETMSQCSSGTWKPQTAKKNSESVRKYLTRAKSNQKPGGSCPRNGDLEECTSARKTPVKSFLASLSVSTPKRRCDPVAQDFKINFKSKKEELTMKLFKLYNSEIFANGLPEDMNFTWNVKMRRTAGYCYNKKILKSTGQVIRLSRIELSTKIVDRADRLRDTLIHELCHAASWVIDGMLDGHGPIWTKWSRKATEKFPELPQIKRCHNYEIASKYTYRCTGCGYSINRCSKSINTDRKRCGYCFGVLELFVNKKKRGKGEVPEFNSTRTISTPNNFALFVKNNYHNVKSMKKDAKHAEIMKILSQQYSLTKEAVKTRSQSANEVKTPSAKK